MSSTVSKRSISSQQEVHLQYERGPPPGNEYLSVFYSQQEIHLQYERGPPPGNEYLYVFYSQQEVHLQVASSFYVLYSTREVHLQNPELSGPTAFMLLSVASYSLLNAELSLAAAVGLFSGVVYSSGAFRLQASLDFPGKHSTPCFCLQAATTHPSLAAKVYKLAWTVWSSRRVFLKEGWSGGRVVPVTNKTSLPPLYQRHTSICHTYYTAHAPSSIFTSQQSDGKFLFITSVTTLFLAVDKDLFSNVIPLVPFADLIQPTIRRSSPTNWYEGTSRLVGAGPLRVRPEVS
uniref:Uncharacterized protein n=1 Tax=Timema tahoe TaxID=61484 RepID=A0A7R9FG14_9NEOP|nr:unnamed protein product [Timema tahoe]